jgi:mannose-6-phosphate isomerase-like protein (cupin superfamily)
MSGYRLVENDAQLLLEAAPGSRSRVLAGACNGARHMAVVERWLDPGVEVADHRHPEGVEEVIWVRGGRGEFRVDGERAEIGPEQTLVIAPLSLHGFRSIGDEPLSLLCRYSSARAPLLAADGGDAGPELPGLEPEG